MRRNRINRQLINIKKNELEEHLEAYKLAFSLQYGPELDLIIKTKEMQYYDCWLIYIKRKAGFSQLIAEIETNIQDYIFDIYINTNFINFKKSDLSFFNYRYKEKKGTRRYLSLEISTNDPLQLIELLILCENSTSILKSM